MENFNIFYCRKMINCPRAAGLQRHRSKAEVQRKAGTNAEQRFTTNSPKFYFTVL